MEADTTQWVGFLCVGAEYELTARPAFSAGCAQSLIILVIEIFILAHILKMVIYEI